MGSGAPFLGQHPQKKGSVSSCCNARMQLALSAVRFLQTSAFAINQGMIPAWHAWCLSFNSILGNDTLYVPILQPIGIFMLQGSDAGAHKLTLSIAARAWVMSKPEVTNMNSTGFKYIPVSGSQAPGDWELVVTWCTGTQKGFFFPVSVCWKRSSCVFF